MGTECCLAMSSSQSSGLACYTPNFCPASPHPSNPRPVKEDAIEKEGFRGWFHHLALIMQIGYGSKLPSMQCPLLPPDHQTIGPAIATCNDLVRVSFPFLHQYHRSSPVIYWMGLLYPYCSSNANQTLDRILTQCSPALELTDRAI